MGRDCNLCLRGTIVGNSVSHSNRRVKRKWRINLVRTKALLSGVVKTILVCTNCLSAGKFMKPRVSTYKK